jgi:hypothetical protein
MLKQRLLGFSAAAVQGCNGGSVARAERTPGALALDP